MITEFEKNTDFFRVALMSAEQLGLFHPNLPNGLFQEAQKVAAPRKEWYESGLLLGNIEPSVIMKRVHNSNRLGRLDWASGYIDLNQMRQQVLETKRQTERCRSIQCHTRIAPEDYNRTSRKDVCKAQMADTD